MKKYRTICLHVPAGILTCLEISARKLKVSVGAVTRSILDGDTAMQYSTTQPYTPKRRTPRTSFNLREESYQSIVKRAKQRGIKVSAMMHLILLEHYKLPLSVLDGRHIKKEA